MAHGQLLWGIVLIAASVASVQGCQGQVDIVFILDESGSVSSAHFQTMREFVRDLVGTLNVSCTGVRVGLIAFSDTVRLQFHLNSYYDPESVKQAIMAVPYNQGGTNTASALQYCRDSMFTEPTGDRCGVPDVAVLLTDGASNNFPATVQQAQLCHDDGIQIIAVGVGDGFDHRELLAVASDPDSEHVFEVSFEHLSDIKLSLQKKACGSLMPSTPSHNCSELNYIPENGTISCLCTTEELGYPPARLMWKLGETTVAYGVENQNELPLPPNILTRQHDRGKLVCGTDREDSDSVELPLNIAYGPDSVEIYAFHHYDSAYNLTFIFHCVVSGVNPSSTDLIEWSGLCEGQRGFTCIVDPHRPEIEGRNATCSVTNNYNNHLTKRATARIETVRPARPTHNCAEVNYIAETSAVACTCSTENLGYPPGQLTWRLRGSPDPVSAGDNGARQLALPSSLLTRDNDRQQAICELSWMEPQSVALPLNIAYGPDSVNVQVYQRCSSSDGHLCDLVFIFRCDVSGLNPRSPDMVHWGGPCEGQTGFTCTLNAQDTNVLGLFVKCRVTNPFNGGRSVEGVAQIQKSGDPQCHTIIYHGHPPTTSHDDDLETKWIWVAGAALVALAVLACLLIVVVLLIRRRSPQQSGADI